MKEKSLKKGFNFQKAKRGARVNPGTAKVAKTIRLDLDIVAWLLKESARTRIPYQTLINSILKRAMDQQRAAYDIVLGYRDEEEDAKLA